MTAYEASLKDKRDFFNSMSAVRKEALQEAAKNLKRIGMDIKAISIGTGLSVEEINAIKLD